MKASYQERRNHSVKRILAQLPKGTSAVQNAFVRQFFISMPMADLEKLDAAQAAKLALSAYEFAEKRTGSEPKIRAFSPNLAEYGYESRRYVVELLNDDMPFLVDSLTNELIRLGFTLHETIHPILRVTRDRAGVLQDIAEPDRQANGMAESFIHFELSPLPAGLTVAQLQTALAEVLAAIRAAVRDWHAMIKKAAATEEALRVHEKKQDAPMVAEARAFLSWLQDKNFVFLGYTDGKERLGICAQGQSLVPYQDKAPLLFITKSDRKASVHRPVLMDVVCVRVGEVVHQFIGLFTSSVYYQSLEAIPVVRQKLAHVMDRSELDPVSHDGKTLKATLEFLPRDEIFQTTEDELLDVGMGLLALEAKPGVRLFVRRDPFERFVSCMLFVPREYFSTGLRITLLEKLATAFQGEVENFYTQMTESSLARLHVIIRTTPGCIPEVDVTALEVDIAHSTHLWSDELYNQLIERVGEAEAEARFRAFGNAFPANYVSRYSISATVFDIEKSVQALRENALAIDFYRLKSEGDVLHLKIYNPSEEIALSDILPMLENMGFRAIDEHPFLIRPQTGGADIWIRDFKLTLPRGQELVMDIIKPLFEEALLKVWRGEMENDRFNALVIRAGLSWREVTLMRALARYLRQIGFAFAQGTIEQVLLAHAGVARNLVALFAARFDPQLTDGPTRQARLVAEIEAQIAQVSTLTDDRILRQYMHVMLAALRTNYYQESRPVLSFKFRSAEVPDMPKPVPFAEIFVYSTRVEGTHLRGGAVARGGLRWSDRHEDFRTEVLGLMKAQMVKNSVIVPVGSKGGFVVKRPPSGGDKDAFQAEGIACYKLYLTGLLDITDNIVDGAVVPPARVLRHDGDDPYLVVAADKGTASFSDIANEVSRSYGFWLDDAFASGGSAGYDHKKMAITARGGWVSVVRHFREMGVDISAKEFTAVGIGDMAGDVFGNGMLLANTLRLVAAFNHLHIFIDPNPDAKASFAERQRLFNLPRSSWKDYDAAKISKGGGVFDRSAKTIPLSREAKAALGVEKDSLTPDELIRAILTAPVDLLWNGGIGTYVKAEDETHEQVGDRANNAVRINGRELKCKVVGEGGNLGFTQKGRVEYARSGGPDGVGGRINTDAIDNSGGVDCSDHEVNIKIAFSNALSTGRLTREKRDLLLARMTDEVAQLVLKDNFLQTQAITLAQAQGVDQLESHSRLMRRLEAGGLLDRGLEYLPSDRALAELSASGKGLTRPELAVLLAYSKIALYREIIGSSLPDEEYFAVDLMRYFPKAMQKDYREEINTHRLRREIIATVMTNSIINRAGMTFFFDMQEDTGLPPRQVAACYAFARDAFDLRDLWLEIERMTATLDTGQQTQMLLSINVLIERLTLWAARNLSQPLDVEKALAFFKPGIQEFRRSLAQIHTPSTQAQYDRAYASLAKAGMSTSFAASIASLEMMAGACDIIRVARDTDLPLPAAGRAYFELGDVLHLGALREQASALRLATHWDQLAVRGLVQDLYDEQRRLSVALLKPYKENKKEASGAVSAWAAAHGETLVRYRQFIDDLQMRGSAGLSPLLVALKHVRMLG